MKERAQAQTNRQQQIYNSMYPSSGRNRTYPLTTATYSGQRYPTQSVPATSRVHHVTASYQNQHHQQNLAPPERLPRSPIPMEEPMAPPNTGFPPHLHPNHVEGPGNCYPPFTESQIAHHQRQLHHEAHLPHSQQHNHSQQVYHHPSTHPSAAQPPASQGVNQTLGGGGYGTASYPPQVMLHGQQYPGCVPPPAPVEAVYPVPVEGGAYYEHHIPPAPYHHHDVLTLNTPTGAIMENLLPGMPPPLTGSANRCAAASQSMPPATGTVHYHELETGEAESHRLPGSSPQYTHGSYGLPLSGTGTGYGSGRSSKDILCGQGGN